MKHFTLSLVISCFLALMSTAKLNAERLPEHESFERCLVLRQMLKEAGLREEPELVLGRWPAGNDEAIRQIARLDDEAVFAALRLVEGGFRNCWCILEVLTSAPETVEDLLAAREELRPYGLLPNREFDYAIARIAQSACIEQAKALRQAGYRNWWVILEICELAQ